MNKLFGLMMLTVCLTPWLGACPADTPAAGPVETCVSAGTQCRIRGGQLGVCTTDATGTLACAPQH